MDTGLQVSDAVHVGPETGQELGGLFEYSITGLKAVVLRQRSIKPHETNQFSGSIYILTTWLTEVQIRVSVDKFISQRQCIGTRSCGNIC